MRVRHLLLVALVAGAAGACSTEEFVLTPVEPGAAVRFINAVPDTGAMDFRFVDIVENSGVFAVNFRAIDRTYYQYAKAGSRHLTIFMNGTTPAVASTVQWDANVTLEANKFYTIILHGNSRTGATPAKALTVLEDAPAPSPSGQVALRAVNLAAGLGTLDVYVSAQGGAVPLPATPTFGGVAYGAASAFVNTAAGTYQYRATATGNTTVLASANALAGAAGTTAANPLPGTSVAGSAVTGFIFPRSVLGSAAPQTLTTPSIVYFWDRRPPNTAP